MRRVEPASYCCNTAVSTPSPLPSPYLTSLLLLHFSSPSSKGKYTLESQQSVGRRVRSADSLSSRIRYNRLNARTRFALASGATRRCSFCSSACGRVDHCSTYPMSRAGLNPGESVAAPRRCVDAIRLPGPCLPLFFFTSCL